MSDKLARPLWRGRTNVDALTIACVERAESFGTHMFNVTQGSYQGGGGDPLSAGTHDLGGVVDLSWCGHNACIVALRKAGMAAWHRTPEQGPWPHHVHAVVIGHPKLAFAADRQVDAYFARRNGLANNGPDDGPRLDPIPRPVWPWPKEDIVASINDLRNVVQDELKPLKEDHDKLAAAIKELKDRLDGFARAERERDKDERERDAKNHDDV